MLQIVVGARQVGDAIAMQQTGPVAARHLQQMVHGALERAGFVAVTCHSPHEAGQAARDLNGRQPGRIVEHPGEGMHPAKAPLDRRPQMTRALETAPEQVAQASQRACQSPFSATRSRLSATAVSRWRNFRPEAARGGRPSSVMALRTAAQ
jgi:hypothetical protein